MYVGATSPASDRQREGKELRKHTNTYVAYLMQCMYVYKHIIIASHTHKLQP